MKIYTKVGDGGSTVLIGGKKVSKTDPRVECVGDLDELNALLGAAAAAAGNQIQMQILLQALQKDIFALSAQAANPKLKKPPLWRGEIKRLEEEIDAAAARLPALKHFVLPGGAPAGATLHYARTVCRRAERRLVAVLQKDKNLRGAQVYLNRLSDYLFLLARLANLSAGARETLWLPKT